MKGFLFGATRCGIKAKGNDLAVVYSEKPCTAAAVFTKNLFAAAPVKYSKQVLAKTDNVRLIVTNSGIANACTGKTGEKNALETAKKAAEVFAVKTNQVLVASTGKIGPQLQVEKIKKGLKTIGLEKDHKNFARAILTTDTVEKTAKSTAKINGKKISILGICKGAGMIRPNMATMLAYITTDANVSKQSLKKMLSESVEKSFNRVTVDGDTSTNDSVFILANGEARNKKIISPNKVFQKSLDQVTVSLAKQIAADGEGATKTMQVTVTGAFSKKDADKAVYAVTNSPLVKTALNGADPNIGRIIAAVGYSGVKLEPEKTKIWVGKKLVFENNRLGETKKLAKTFSQKNVEIRIELGVGKHESTGWGCDYSKKYVEINAEYHT